MSDRPALWFPLVLLAALTALTTWLDFEVRSSMTEAASRNRHDPDTILHNFSTRQTGKTGMVELTLQAKTMRHYMDDGSTDMEAPLDVSSRQAAFAHRTRGRRAFGLAGVLVCVMGEATLPFVRLCHGFC